MPDFTSLPLPVNLALFGASAIGVWVVGTRLARWASALSRLTGIGDAVIGVVLLGGITSLPELATSVTGALRDEVALSVNNLLGGLAFQVMLLAIADAFVGRDALSSVNARPVVMLQATLDCLMLTVVAIAIVVGDTALPFGVGAWSFVLLPLYLIAVTIIARARGQRAWHPAGHERDEEGLSARHGEEAHSVRQLVIRIAAAAAFVLAGGAVATMSAEGIAEQTGIGSSFVGAVMLAGATSFPELSTAIEAVRLRRYSMAFADVFGTNLIDAALILVVDGVASGPPVLNTVGTFSIVAALLGVLLTMVYMVGLLERRDRVVARMGVDSVVVLVAYLGGLLLLYQLR